MILRLMNSHDAGLEYSSKWVDIAPDMKGRSKKAHSLQISWKDIVGPLNGFLMLSGSNDMSNAGYKKIYELKTADNYDDAELIVIRQMFKFLRIEYVPVGIISGRIDAHLYYK